MVPSLNPSRKKQKYKKFLELHDDAPVYIQDWYLDLVCGEDNWEVCIVEKGSEVAAVLPYYLRRNRLFRWIAMPPLSKMHGPYLSGKYKTARHHHTMVEELLEQLPKVDYYQQGLSYGFVNWLPYLWQGYSQVTLYSYVFEKLDPPAVLTAMEPDCRRRIKNAERSLNITHDLPFDRFFDLLKKTFQRQNLPAPFEEQFLAKYYREMKDRGVCSIISVVDLQGVVYSSALLIWDKSTAYYLLEASDPASANKNAGIFLKWKAIEFARYSLGLENFDFEGSISRRIEKIYREFGAQAKPYYVIKKYHSKMFLLFKFIQNVRQYGRLVQW